MSVGIGLDYIMDNMRLWEIPPILKYSYYADRSSWEQTRWLGNLYINAHSKNTVELKDTIKFQWEKEEEQENDVNLPDADKMRAFITAQDEIFRRGESATATVTLRELKN